MPARPLTHVDADKKDDETLRAEARSHLADAPSLQFVAELLTKLRLVDLPFWSPQILRERWNAAERLRWFRHRPDLRQKITSSLTGLAPKASRKKMADFQAALIDSVVDEGDIPVRAFEASFDPSDLAVYGSAAAYWHAMRELFPWRDDAPVHQEVVAWLLKALLADTSNMAGLSRVPILTPWDLRTAIDGRVWHTRIPLEVRVAIDDARFSQERDRPGAPFHAQDDLAIAVPDILAATIPLRDFAGVLDAAERAMGFDKEAPKPKGPPEIKSQSAVEKSAAPERANTQEPAALASSSAAPNAAATSPGAAASPTALSSLPAVAPNASTTAATTNPSVSPTAAAPSTTAALSVGAASPAAVTSASAATPPTVATTPVATTPVATATNPGIGPGAPHTITLPQDLHRRGPTPGVPTLEDELERTNPWVVPSAEELAAATESALASEPDSVPGRRRRRG